MLEKDELFKEAGKLFFEKEGLTLKLKMVNSRLEKIAQEINVFIEKEALNKKEEDKS